MEDIKKALGTYTRAFMASILTLVLAGTTDPKALLAAGLASVLPPIIRWVDPSDKEYGKK